MMIRMTKGGNIERPTFKPATRQGVKPLIGLYAESGCGKTLSALFLARGMVGPNGKIGLADSESGRGSIYADIIPGGYETLSIEAPFSPRNYIAVVETAEKANLDCLVIDSGSHEWEGIGGVLDMAGENEQAGKKGLAVWKTPKMEHAKFVLKLLQTRLPVIVCLRAKYKSRQVKNAKGFTEIVKDEKTTPIQADDFIFEMTAHAEILQDHTIQVTKCSHPALRACFPGNGKEPLSIKHGEAIAAWANNPGGEAPQKPAAGPSTNPTGSSAPAGDDVKALKRELWNLTKSKHQGDQAAFSQWLWDEGAMADTEHPSEMTADRLAEVIAAAKAKL